MKEKKINSCSKSGSKKTMDTAKIKLWDKVKEKFQRDASGRIIVPNRSAYAIIFLLILVIIGANIMLHRKTYADTGIEITANSTVARNAATDLPKLNGVESGPIEVTIKYLQEKEGYKNEYSIDNGKTWNEVRNNIAYVECRENKTIKARILDEEENEISQKDYVVSNVDNEKPNAFDYDITSITQSQTKHFNNGENDEDLIKTATINLSINNTGDKGPSNVAGIARWEYRISTDEGNSYSGWSSTTQTSVNIENMEFDKTYMMQVRAIDYAGNERLATNIKQFRFTKSISHNIGRFEGGSILKYINNVTAQDYICKGCNNWMSDIEGVTDAHSALGMIHYKQQNGNIIECGTYDYWRKAPGGRGRRTVWIYKCSLCNYDVRSRGISESEVDGATGTIHCWNRTETVSMSTLSPVQTDTRYSIQVVKLDEQGRAVQGANITVGGTTKATDENGIITLDNLTAQNDISYEIKDQKSNKNFTMTFNIQGSSTKIISNAKLTGANGDARIEIDNENKIIRVIIQPKEYKLKVINEDAEKGTRIEGAKYEISINGQKSGIGESKTEGLKEGEKYIIDNSGEMTLKGIEKGKTNKVEIKQVKAEEEYYEYESEKLEIEIEVDENGNITNLEKIENDVKAYGDKISEDSMKLEYDEENKTIKIIQKNVKRYKIKFINESTLGRTRIPNAENYIRLNYEDKKDRIEVGKTEVYEDTNGESYYITDENGEINLGGILKGANREEIKENHIYIQQKKENASYQNNYVGVPLTLDFEIDSSGRIVNEANVKGQAKAQGDMIITDSFYININKETQTIEITMQNVPYITMGIKKTRVTNFGTKDLWVDDNGINGARYKVTSYINGENVLEAESETETVEGIRGIAKATLGAGVNEIGIQEIGTGELAGDVDSKEYRIK